MRKHILLSGLAAVVLLCFIVGPSFARAPNYRAQQDRPLTPKKGVLHMFETEDDGSWQLTRRAARGKLTYRLWGETFNFFFQGRRLVSEEAYVLIYIPESPEYPESFAQSNHVGVELGRANSDKRGRLYMVGSIDTCTMAAEGSSSSEVVGHIWLVPEGALELDYHYDEIIQFEEPISGEYLKGFHTVRFMDTDGCDEEPYYEEPEEPAGEDPGEEEPEEEVIIIGPY